MAAARCDLLETALAEVTRREPEYFKWFPVRVSPQADARRTERLWPSERVDGRSMLEVLDEGLDWFGRRGVRLDRSSEHSDDVGRMLVDAIADAALAECGRLPLRAPAISEGSILDVLARDYDLHEGVDGTPRYIVRRRGGRPLVIVNAVGIPLHPWQQLLADQGQGYRVAAVESRAADLLEGGLRAPADISSEAQAIAAVLEREGLTDAVVVGWCNGGRVAVEVAARCAERVTGLVLLSPTMMGVPHGNPRCSDFEARLDVVFRSVRSRPPLAAFFAETLDPNERPDWDRLAPDQRAAALVRLPSRALMGRLRAPLSTAQSLINYAIRGGTDPSYPLDRALASVQAPILVITGQNDETVSNELTAQVVRRLSGDVTEVAISGAGHHINDLQYHYLIMLIEAWARRDGALPPSARATPAAARAVAGA